MLFLIFCACHTFYFLLHPFVISLSAACAAEIIWCSKGRISCITGESDGTEGEEGMSRGACVEGARKERRRNGQLIQLHQQLFCFPSLIPPLSCCYPAMVPGSPLVRMSRWGVGGGVCVFGGGGGGGGWGGFKFFLPPGGVFRNPNQTKVDTDPSRPLHRY